MQNVQQIDHAEITYYENLSVSPEQKLVAAIIRRAIFDAFCHLNGSREYEHRDAYRWLIRKTKKRYSFRWWCDLAHLDYTYLQKRITDLNYKLPKMQ